MSLNPPLQNWQGRRVWLIGASTGIGRALALALMARGARLIVSARASQALSDLAAQNPGCRILPLDVTHEGDIHVAALEAQRDGPLDLVCYCAGHYQPMRASAIDFDDLLRHQQVNLVGALRMMDAVLPGMIQGRQGHISFVSSVAGFRGLPKSLAYGPTKAALIHLAETLYLDLHPLGLGVSVINPGFVRTPLTAQNDFHMPALISPEEAAQSILKGWEQGEFDIHFPKRFTRVMKLLRLLPYRLYFSIVRHITRA